LERFPSRKGSGAPSSRHSAQFSAAVAAIREMGVLSGQRIERREVGTPGEFDAFNDDELERALVERFNALGFNDRCRK
jgi:hypothetical protein